MWGGGYNPPPQYILEKITNQNRVKFFFHIIDQRVTGNCVYSLFNFDVFFKFSDSGLDAQLDMISHIQFYKYKWLLVTL